MDNNCCEWDFDREGYWAARGSSLSAAMIKYSFIATAHLATSWGSRTRDGRNRATKSSTMVNGGRPEEADTAHSLGEEGSMKQLETHQPHRPNTKIIPISKTSTDISSIFKQKIPEHAFFQDKVIQIPLR